MTDRPVIMDPPARRTSHMPAQTSGGFPSPTLDHASANPKFVDDCTRMTYAIQQSLPEAVRRIVRDHWEKCLLGTEFHQAFIVSCISHINYPLYVSVFPHFTRIHSSILLTRPHPEHPCPRPRLLSSRLLPVMGRVALAGGELWKDTLVSCRARVDGLLVLCLPPAAFFIPSYL
ncbi:uncharacterized protein PODANS_6_1140 [Podospora anserina S mat+]|uniref:Podospora anserina S mat+ genomic DNA chromosome 6, supercontig 2 n=1 Tax=Podospora anserina (strain S / ATCC MYA-4624 / DSM 980 / FGSC 10383) TaxID=515849 RepID=B2B342_PODAN|nr:uncharacterized protein PODANS_6_1140 [Podospora anserina S mat+]CAP71528.1 unnamed protein product [Podospora anserina S mat+]CDP30924.1 Putative protein of unknown function [Podospora anserina S mat+]